MLNKGLFKIIIEGRARRCTVDEHGREIDDEVRVFRTNPDIHYPGDKDAPRMREAEPTTPRNLVCFPGDADAPGRERTGAIY